QKSNRLVDGSRHSHLPQTVERQLQLGQVEKLELAPGRILALRPMADTLKQSLRLGSNMLMDKQRIDRGQQFEAKRRLEAINQTGRFLQCWQIGFGFGFEIQVDLIAPGIVEPDDIQGPAVADALITLQVTAIQSVQQMAQPVSIGAVVFGFKAQIKRV